ncbi:NAD-dependent epimerase/dehydratase family protein [Nonomuraea bangladeshensis]|uniref:NAD-dependent epimerase/dehydratase family protein n=1 Tax=Nonomuraea bangladeshensis TaxID=404385 RepID=A0ABV3H0B3_9ACTN
MILVTGATGLVGRHLITTLRGDGAEVRALSRRPETAGLPVRRAGGRRRAGRPGVAGAGVDRHRGVVRAPHPDAAAEHAGDFR